jgi:hypothetical protein
VIIIKVLVLEISTNPTVGTILMVPEVVGVVEVGTPTVKINGGLVIPDKVAVMSVVPSATVVTRLPAEIVATARLELAQVTWEVTAEYAVSE